MIRHLPPHFYILAFFLSLSASLSAQIVGSNVYLQGCYVEVGISDCGVYGTSVLPPAAGGPFGPYHPKPEYFGGGSYFGFVADHQKDGWATGTPNYCGDYFVPGSPVEGWQVQYGASTYTNTDVGCWTSDIAGGVTDYTDTGGYKSATWVGSIPGLNLDITQKTTFPDGALFFLTTVTLCNEGATDLVDVYYKRNVDPDQDEPWSGDYTTTNIVVSNPPANDTALVTAEGLEYGCFLGIGAIDPNARVSWGNFGTTAAPPSASFAGTSGYSIVGTMTSDIAIQITFKETIPAGECVTINFAHVLDPSDLAQALQATLLGSIGVLADSVEIDTTGVVNICKGDSVDLDIEFGADYVWTWTPSAGLNVDTGLSVIAFPDTTTTYTATGIGDCATLTKNVIITVHDANGLANAGPDKFLCEGDTIGLDGSGGVSYLWSPPSYLSNDTIATPAVQDPLTNMVYTLVITDAWGCTDTDDVVVNLYPNPVIDAGEDQLMIKGGFAQLAATGGVTYTWTPGLTLSDSTIFNPIATPDDTTMYYVTAIDDNGCYGYDSVTIFVLDNIAIVSPNAFTPNGDGLNDTYRPYMIGPGDITGFMIYDRWGRLIFSSNDPNVRWDGTFDGKEQEIGTYIVYITAKNFLGQELKKSATLTLIR